MGKMDDDLEAQMVRAALDNIKYVSPDVVQFGLDVEHLYTELKALGLEIGTKELIRTVLTIRRNEAEIRSMVRSEGALSGFLGAHSRLADD